ncbi:MAG: hypothetical protein ACLR56_13345 [Oscillospiraceae bacterium]
MADGNLYGDPRKDADATAMKRVLDYVMQDKKTVIDGIKLVSGQHCVLNRHIRSLWLPSINMVKQRVYFSNSMCNP